MFQILAEYGYKLLRMRYLPICLVTTSSCCAINPNALAIFERSVVLSLAELSLVVSFDTGGAGAFGLLVGTGGAGLFDLYLLTAALALLGLGRLLVFLFVFAFAGAFLRGGFGSNCCCSHSLVPRLHRSMLVDRNSCATP